MKHDVHIFAIVRVKVPDVEAPSHETAITAALQAVDLAKICHRNGYEIEYANDISHYMVDEWGDPGHSRTRSYQEASHLRTTLYHSGLPQQVASKPTYDHDRVTGDGPDINQA